MLNLIKWHKEFFLSLILVLSLLWPLVTAPFFSHHDDVQVIRLHQMNKCFMDKQIPCRWVPDLGGQYGYPIFNYYAPLPYYFGELVYLLTGSLIISVKLMFALSFVGSFILMYLFARKFWGELGGTVSALFYAYAPYHALDFYVRGAMGEMWALMAFPGIVWSLTKLWEKPNLSNLLLLSSFSALLFTSHNLSMIIFIPLLLALLVFLLINKKSYNFLGLVIGSFSLAILLSSFYLLPMVVEKRLVHVDTTTYGYFSFTEHFKGLRKVLLDRSWGWGSSIREVPGGERDGMSYQIGWVHLLGWALALYSARSLWHKNKFLGKLIVLLSLILAFSIFMIHPRSEFIWKLVEPLKYLQFPWRFLSIVIFLIAFLSGSIFLALEKRKLWLWWVLVVLVVALNFFYFRPEKFIHVTEEQLLTGENWDRQIKRSIFDYLPIFAKEPPAELASSRYEILTGKAEIRDFTEGTNWIKFKADVKEHTIIRLSQYYFPNWIVRVDGKEINVEYMNNNLGLMTFILGEGSHSIEARLHDTLIRSFANWVTLAGLFIFTLLFLLQFKSVQGWIRYYLRRVS